MMVELELTEVNDKNKAALRNLEMLLASSKDTESDLLQRLDSMAKDNDDFVSKVSFWIFLPLLIETFSEVNTYNDNVSTILRIFFKLVQALDYFQSIFKISEFWKISFKSYLVKFCVAKSKLS